MKKCTAMLLVLVLCLALGACGVKDDSDATTATTEGVYCWNGWAAEKENHAYFITVDNGKIVFEQDPGWGDAGIDAERIVLASGTYEKTDGPYEELDIHWDQAPGSAYQDFDYEAATHTISFTYDGYDYSLRYVHKKDEFGHTEKDMIPMAEDIVMQELITASPSVTEFCKDKDCTAICYGFGKVTWLVRGWVDTQSETGQSVRYDWFVKLTFKEGSTEPDSVRVWKLD